MYKKLMLAFFKCLIFLFGLPKEEEDVVLIL